MKLEDTPSSLVDFWRDFDPELERADLFYDAFQVGYNPALADAGARYILDGSKRTTSSLLWEYEQSGRPPPQAGMMSILLDGLCRPLCLIETTSVQILSFDGVDDEFCKAYAESDGSKEGWLALNWPIYSAQCQAWGREPSMVMPLVCEWFEVVFPIDPLTLRRTLRTLKERHQ
jgi:uncharacterized protein YhfF